MKGGLLHLVTNIFTTVTDIITGVLDAMITIFTSIADVFYDSTASQLTIVGIFALLGFGVGLAKWGFNLILKLIKMRG